MENFEIKYRDRLIERLSSDFYCHKEPKGIFCFQSQNIGVRGDLMLLPKEKLIKQGFPNKPIIIELKDSNKRHFAKSELIRQCICLSLSQFDGLVPVGVFMVLPDFEYDIFSNDEKNIYQQFNIGEIRIFGEKINLKKLMFKIGNHVILRQNEEYSLVFDKKYLDYRFKFTIGTDAKTNKISLI